MKKGEEDSEVIVDEQDNTWDGSPVENFLHDIEEDEISKLKEKQITTFHPKHSVRMIKFDCSFFSFMYLESKKTNAL